MGWIFGCFKSAIVANGLDSPRNRVATMTERPFDRFWVLWPEVICCGTGKPQTVKNNSMTAQTGLCSGR